MRAPGFALATDLAELLVRRGVPFREAHEVVGHLVVWCQVNDCDLPDVSDENLAKISPYLTPDVREVLSVTGALAARSTLGERRRSGWRSNWRALRGVVDEHAGLGGGLTGGVACRQAAGAGRPVACSRAGSSTGPAGGGARVLGLRAGA